MADYSWCIQSGETYPFPPETTEQDAHHIWIELPQETYVATNEDGKVLGTYYIKPNQACLGAHVCNCGYMVSEGARGRGVAASMCKHSQELAVKLDFKAMQFNLVVSTNEAAVHLWQKLGLQIVGTLPKTFKSKKFGYVDALIMYKQLVM